MKVYALFLGEYTSTTFWGVYTTREAAVKVAEDAREEGRINYCQLGAHAGDDGAWVVETETDVDWGHVRPLVKDMYPRSFEGKHVFPEPPRE